MIVATGKPLSLAPDTEFVEVQAMLHDLELVAMDVGATNFILEADCFVAATKLRHNGRDLSPIETLVVMARGCWPTLLRIFQ